jgi:Tfp pilus assembly pilus retraction ATPase PilT
VGFPLDRYLKMLSDRNGTDLHVAAGTVPKFRIHGKLHPVPDEPPWEHARVEELLLPMLDERRRGIFLERRDLDWAYSLPGVARFTRTFWMSMPEESRHLARMQATWTLVRETVRQQQGMLLSRRDDG